MKKQKTKLIFFVCASLLVGLAFVATANATSTPHGGAIISWTAPTANEDDSTPVDLSGYRIYYSTSTIDCTNWDAALAADRKTHATDGTLLPSTYTDVGNVTTYRFGVTTLLASMLAHGTTGHFAVVAYDSSGNLSKCATGGTNGAVTKPITYAGDLNKDCAVNNLDYTYWHHYYHGNDPGADINGDGTVDSIDYGFIHADYNQSFSACNQS